MFLVLLFHVFFVKFVIFPAGGIEFQRHEWCSCYVIPCLFLELYANTNFPGIAAWQTNSAVLVIVVVAVQSKTSRKCVRLCSSRNIICSLAVMSRCYLNVAGGGLNESSGPICFNWKVYLQFLNYILSTCRFFQDYVMI